MSTQRRSSDRLSQEIAQLTEQLSDVRRALRRMHLLLASGVITALLATATAVLAPSSIETAQAQMYQPTPPYGAQPMRQAPSAQVPSTDRERILRRALAQLDDPNRFDSEAAIAVYLYDLNRNMSGLSSINDELRTISRQLDANTHIANEMREMNIKMTTITQSIDSTMGVMGRMMNQMLLYSY